MKDSVIILISLLVILGVCVGIRYLSPTLTCLENFAPYGTPTTPDSQPSSPENSPQYDSCLSDGFTPAFCQERLLPDTCLCSNGSVGRRLPGFGGACVCDSQVLQEYQIQRPQVQVDNKICLTPSELQQIQQHGQEAPRRVLEKVMSQYPFNPEPYSDYMLNGLF